MLVDRLSGYKGILDKLHELGFGKYEGRVYITLVANGILTAPAIAKISGIPKSKVYETAARLVAKRMIDEHAGPPRKFKARLPKFVFDEIVEEEKKKIAKLQKIGQEIHERVASITELQEKTLIDSEHLVWSVNGKQALFEKYAEMLSRAKKEVVGTSVTFVSNPLMAKCLKGALERGVKARAVGYATENSTEMLKHWLKLGAEIRDYGAEMPIRVIIIDNKECFYRVQYERRGAMNYVGIWTKDPGFIKVFREYWKQLWKDSKPVTLSSLPK